MASIVERDDVLYVCVYAPTEGDEGAGFHVGHRDVTAIKIVKRYGPADWLPYVEVWKGDRLHAEMPQHNTCWLEFKA